MILSTGDALKIKIVTLAESINRVLMAEKLYAPNAAMPSNMANGEASLHGVA